MNFLQEKQIIERNDFLQDFFLKSHDTKNISVIIVTHIISSSISFINIINKYFSLECIIPKPNSINKKCIDLYPKDKLFYVTRNELKDIKFIKKKLESIPKNNKLIIIDIGGYFVHIADEVKKIFGNRFIGIIEDTENGYQKYILQFKNTFPLLSVAKSPLKKNEDHLVGQSVVFSTDALLREQNILINNKNVGVIGYGKIGKGILSSLRDKCCTVSVHDINTTVLVIAYSKGYSIKNKIQVLEKSDIIFCSTGNFSLKDDEFKYLKNGSFLISVTSSDDEIDDTWLRKKYTIEYIAEYIQKFELNGHYFYLINKGNAVNFIHEAVVDNFILLIQKEIIDSIIYMSCSQLENKIYYGFERYQKRISDLWLKYFLHINI
jgi:adenosylhomocysteinase